MGFVHLDDTFFDNGMNKRGEWRKTQSSVSLSTVNKRLSFALILTPPFPKLPAKRHTTAPFCREGALRKLIRTEVRNIWSILFKEKKVNF